MSRACVIFFASLIYISSVLSRGRKGGQTEGERNLLAITPERAASGRRVAGDVSRAVEPQQGPYKVVEGEWPET